MAAGKISKAPLAGAAGIFAGLFQQRVQIHLDEWRLTTARQGPSARLKTSGMDYRTAGEDQR